MSLYWANNPQCVKNVQATLPTPEKTVHNIYILYDKKVIYRIKCVNP